MNGVEPVLAMDDIQGNVLEGFNKPYQQLVGLRIQDVKAAKKYLRRLADSIATLREVHEYKKKYLWRSKVAQRKRPPTTWTNVSFSWLGLKELVAELAKDGFDPAFVQGQWRRSMSHLGDPVESDRPGSITKWKVGGSDEATPHILLIVASDDKGELRKRVQGIRSESAKCGLTLNYDELGQRLPGRLKGHEQFGFNDNLSSPRPRGLVSSEPNEFLVPRQSGLPQNPALPEFASPGQPLVWPGQFVLGYETQSITDPRCCNLPVPPEPEWLKDGSYLVFRRLRQDVAGFRRFVSAQTKKLRSHPGFKSITEEKFGAMIVGRWQSGAPLSLTPHRNNNRLARSNDFLYLGKPWSARHPSPPDLGGSRCPVSAHIRKTNPRDQGTDLGPPADTLSRLLLRRGIAYGPPLLPGEEKNRKKAAIDRGLLFMSYQSSICESFERIVQDWVNGSAGPTPPPCFDLLIGTNPGPGGERFTYLSARNGTEVKIATKDSFVYATGGGYFFTPSIFAIRNVLGG